MESSCVPTRPLDLVVNVNWNSTFVCNSYLKYFWTFCYDISLQVCSWVFSTPIYFPNLYFVLWSVKIFKIRVFVVKLKWATETAKMFYSSYSGLNKLDQIIAIEFVEWTTRRWEKVLCLYFLFLFLLHENMPFEQEAMWRVPVYQGLRAWSKMILQFRKD